MEKLVCRDIKEIFARLNRMAAEKKQYLIELDGVMGDGDLGLTMAAVFKAADTFAADFTDEDAGALFMKTGMVMAKAAPSTMGTLMATGFMRGGKALKGLTEVDTQAAGKFWRAFTDGIMERGKAKPGEKTIIDALNPASQALEKAADMGESLTSALQKASDAAQTGLESTKGMMAQHGRAAYYQEKSKDVLDPGATIGAYVVKVFADYVQD
ncbi:MAG: dihydroxyacetone kinase subunit L [Spirochaetales bacterium]|jgi:dihydroxyacetone kinase-like protein|nr:dihydroxyacetone kinase subunit L [Spirochaetales bacterium]